MAVSLLQAYSVLELSETPGGAFCAKLLADMGASVLKVEPPDGDPARSRGAFSDDVPDSEASGLFLFLNANKRGITLNLDTATGREIATRLAERADLIVEDLPPGFLSERGLGYQELSAVNPGLVLISLSPFGQTGPNRSWKATPLTTYHAGGHAYHVPSGPAARELLDRPPVAAGRLVGEFQSAMVATLAGLAALLGRNVLGGQHVDVSKQEALINLVRTEHARYPNEGVVIGRTTSDAPFVGGMLPCRDGWIECVVMEDAHWAALLELLDNPSWAAEQGFATQAERVANVDHLYECLAAETIKRSGEELYRRGQALGCPLGKVLSAPEVLACEQLEARGYFSTIKHPVAGSLRYPSLPFTMPGEPVTPDLPAPILGQENASVLRELGFDDEAVSRLSGTGVI
jgi:CoA:oxalate CoA-transferase